MFALEKIENPYLYGLLVTLRATVLLLISGTVIGLLHQWDWILAVICVVRIGYFVFVNGPKYLDANTLKIVYLGMGITCVSGVLTEALGIYFDFWNYHDLSGGRVYPLWLPFMWALSFLFLFRIESRYIRLLSQATYFQKLLVTAFVSMVFPTIGEFVTINLGVWTYYDMGPQLWGVPYLAMFLLMILHTAIFTFLCYWCKIKRIETAIFKF